MRNIGKMAMPAGFKYRNVYLKGKPQHQGWDDFTIKHPPMPASRWAKIFAPFDALKGFDEAIEEQEELFVRKPELSGFQKEQLDEKIGILHRMTRNGKLARENKVTASVEYFEASATDRQLDGQGDGCETLGKIKKIDGQVWKVDITFHSIQIADSVIDLADVIDIESNVFDENFD